VLNDYGWVPCSNGNTSTKSRHVIPSNAVIGCNILPHIFQHVWKPVINACMNCSALHAVIAHETTELRCLHWLKTRHRVSTSTRWHFAFALCCHSNETRVPIANPPNRAQLGDTHTIYPSYPGPCSRLDCSAGMRRGAYRQRHRRACPVYISRRLATTHAKCNKNWTHLLQTPFTHLQSPHNHPTFISA